MSCGEVALVLLEIVGLAVVVGGEEVMLVVEDEVEGVWEDAWRFDGILRAGGGVKGFECRKGDGWEISRGRLKVEESRSRSVEDLVEKTSQLENSAKPWSCGNWWEGSLDSFRLQLHSSIYHSINNQHSTLNTQFLF